MATIVPGQIYVAGFRGAREITIVAVTADTITYCGGTTGGTFTKTPDAFAAWIARTGAVLKK